MEFRQTSLLMEEKISECLPADYGVGISPDGKHRFAAIILREYLKDKGLYENADIKSRWEAAHFRIIGMEKVFLELDFGNERKLKFYINLYDLNFITIRDLWFSLIIERNGMIAISDKREPSIIADKIPIDIPKLILEHMKRTEITRKRKRNDYKGYIKYDGYGQRCNMLKESYLAVMNKLPQDSVKIVVSRTAGSVLSPSWDLLNDYKNGKIKWDGYVERFTREMNNDRCIAEMRKIKWMAKDKDVYLLCYEKRYPCHRFLLIDMINSLDEK